MNRILILFAGLTLCSCVELRGAIKCGSQGVEDYDPGPPGAAHPHCN